MKNTKQEQVQVELEQFHYELHEIAKKLHDLSMRAGTLQRYHRISLKASRGAGKGRGK
jgi:hypothetical protein